MITRLRAAWRALVGPAVVSTVPPVACARCVELETDRTYWRSREERATEALLMRDAGVVGTALPMAKRENILGTALAAYSKQSYKGKTETHLQPGQGAMSGSD